eukprot:gb/GECH01002560.1/.p1 GENE.gb/GECH01002560.1/~~gb/GECH01002560.1/.p1  ORF type:complete len:712 (+),score=216.95 gb/GECH01002560.1/:1-2136(+)
MNQSSRQQSNRGLKRKRVDTQQLSQDVVQWAVDDMGYKPSGRYAGNRPPSAADVKLVCRGQMNSVWQFLINHIHTEQFVTKVKGNLKLHGKDESKHSIELEYKRLQEERNRLLSEINSTRSDISKVDHEMEKITDEISEYDHKSDKNDQKSDEYRQRAIVLSAFGRRVKQETSNILEYLRKFNSHSKFVYQANNVEDLEMGYYSEHQDNLETPSMKNVRELEEKIEQYLRHHYRHSPFEQLPHQSSASAMSSTTATGIDLNASMDFDESEGITAEISKLTQRSATVSFEELEREVRDRLGNGAQTFEALLGLMKQHNRRVEDEIESTTPAIYRQMIREKLAQQYRRDKERGVHLDVESLLAERCQEHVDMFVETERWWNEKSKWEEEIAPLEKQIEQMDQARYYNSNQNDLKEQLRTLRSKERIRASNREALRTLSQRIKALEHSKDRFKQLVPHLEEKSNRIQHLERLYKEKRQLIKTIISDNVQYRHQVKEQQQRVREIIDMKICPAETTAPSLTQRLQNYIQHEYDTFKRIPWEATQRVTINPRVKPLRRDLSINASSDLIEEIRQIVNYPNFKSTDSFISHIIKLKLEAQRREHRYHAQQQRLSHLHQRQRGTTEARVGKMAEAVDRQRSKQYQQWLPTVERATQDAQDAVQETENVQELLSHWWEQPGAYTVPWIRYGGKTVEEWEQQLHRLTTKMQQLHGDHSHY